MVGFLLAAAIAVAAPQAQPQAPAAEPTPAIFVVRDADTTIYIFGTFHALDGRTIWFTGPVKQAFESSRELVLETVIPEGPVQGRPPVTGRPPVIGRPLPVTPSASFLATTRVAIDAGRSQGMQVGNGADMV